MKKYKVIKEYPGSIELNSILRVWTKVDHKKGEYLYGSSNSLFPGLEPSIVENYPEYFEEVVERDYKILSFKNNQFNTISTLRKHGKYYLDNTEDSSLGWTEDEFHNNKNCTIYSIKRVSDGEIFTVGDKIEYDTGKTLVSTIAIVEAFTLFTDNIYFHINNDKNIISFKYIVQKAKQPFFTTEDGIGICIDDEYFCIDKNFKIEKYIF